MGSKELYIQPILEENLSVVPGLSENIGTMTAQLNETTRILMNMLSNQGLQLHQTAYNGSAFSALTHANSWGVFDYAIPAFLALTDSNQNVCKPDAVGNTNFTKVSGVDFETYVFGIYLNNEKNYHIPATVSMQLWSNVATSWRLIGNFSFTDGTNTGELTSTSSGSGSTPCEFTIPNEHQGKLINGCYLRAIFSGGSGTGTYQIGTPIFADADGNSLQLVNKRIKTLKFNSANAFTYYAAPTSGNITAEVYANIIPQTAYITLPDIQNVGTWATFLINGNIDGANISIVDNTSHNLLLSLPAATSDITDLVQTNNLALSVSMTAETQVINSIAQRYY